MNNFSGMNIHGQILGLKVIGEKTVVSPKKLYVNR